MLFPFLLSFIVPYSSLKANFSIPKTTEIMDPQWLISITSSVKKRKKINHTEDKRKEILNFSRYTDKVKTFS